MCKAVEIGKRGDALRYHPGIKNMIKNVTVKNIHVDIIAPNFTNIYRRIFKIFKIMFFMDVTKLPNYYSLFSRRLRRGVWFEVDSTLSIHYKNPDSHPVVLLYSFKFCAPVVFIWFWLFFRCVWGQVGKKGSDITKKKDSP